MNKNLKKIIAIALAVGTFSAVTPATNLNFLTTKAYASSNDETTAEKITLRTSNGDSIQLYDDDDYKSGSKIENDDVSDNGEYYAKTSSKKINISVKGPSSKYVKVFKGTSSSTKGKSISDDIELSSGTTTLTVKIYDSTPDSDVRYDDDSESEYQFKVKYTGGDSTSSDDNADSYDDIYLNGLSVDGNSISLSDSKVVYSYNVPNNTSEVSIKAVPEYDDYTVTIDGYDVDDDDNYKRKVSLNTGDNTIKVQIQDEDNNDERVYTLKINRGAAATTNTATTQTNTAANISTVKTGWVQANGGLWQYNDSLGHPLVNQWFTDMSNGKQYFLQPSGYMATGWLNYGGNWYYLNSDGSKVTSGWVLVNGSYYYLDSNGVMAVNTTISGYKVGSDGAWIR